jgi:hypothetical protein
MPFVPEFLQRHRLLGAARRALAAGRPETALQLLDDPRLAGSARAERLREVAHGKLALAREREPGGAAAGHGKVESALLATLRRLAAGEPVLGLLAGGAVARAGEAASVSAEAPRPAPGRAPRFLLFVDDGGAYLAAVGPKIVVGHSRAQRADLVFLADVAPDHAVLRFAGESFHGGATWRLEPLGRAELAVDGEALPPSGRVLHHGDHLELAPTLGARFLLPDPASSSAVLELDGGADCAGAGSILLIVPGDAGRIAIGARHHHHVRAPLGEATLELTYDAGRLRLACEQGLCPFGDVDTGPLRELGLACPPGQSQSFRIGASAPGERPLSITIAPLPGV